MTQKRVTRTGKDRDALHNPVALPVDADAVLEDLHGRVEAVMQYLDVASLCPQRFHGRPIMSSEKPCMSMIEPRSRSSSRV